MRDPTRPLPKQARMWKLRNARPALLRASLKDAQVSTGRARRAIARAAATASLAEKYEPVIGLETHVQVTTASKAFCGCPNEYGAEPNTNVCPICLGHPGTLPAVNATALRKGVALSMALDCEVEGEPKFDRKQYFYPDLPKGYQISQHDVPLATDGRVTVDMPPSQGGHRKQFGIERVHMEEDAGKSFHTRKGTLVDYNRAGVPLLEIVSKPEFASGREAAAYAEELRRLVRFAGIGNAEMSEGSMRCDVNVSVRVRGQTEFGTKVEIKNLNSLASLARAIDYEFERQSNLLSQGREGDIVQETRTWDEQAQETVTIRKKEGLSDYRYFPEPDLPRAVLSPEFREEASSTLPELPHQMRDRFLNMGLPLQDVQALVDEVEVAAYFDECVREGMPAKEAANWVLTEVLSYVNANKVAMADLNLRPRHLRELHRMEEEEQVISGRIAKESILPELLEKGGDPRHIVERDGLAMVSDSAELERIVEELMESNPKEVEKFRNGKKKVKGFFVGQVMQRTGGKANPQVVDQLLTGKLSADEE